MNGYGFFYAKRIYEWGSGGRCFSNSSNNIVPNVYFQMNIEIYLQYNYHIILIYIIFSIDILLIILDIDDCLNVTCSNGGSCVDFPGYYTCKCLNGFEGDHCEIGLQ
jgi:hypothetical protein